MNDLPEYIIAYEYQETCGNTHLGDGILLVDSDKNEICRLTNGTIREYKIAVLFENSLDLLNACEKLIAGSNSANFDLEEIKNIVKKIKK